MNKTAIIIGITSQDGSYLSELLLSKNYNVIGVKRRSSTTNLYRLKKIVDNPQFSIVDGDVTDYSSMYNIINEYEPDEVYNLAAMSFVAESFKSPHATVDIDFKGELNVLECIKNINKDIKHYFAASSEQYGSSVSSNNFQDENTPMIPNSPYSVAKLASFNLVKIYREAYKMFCCSGILFNHESPRRGEEFVTKKITKYLNDLIKNYAFRENGFTYIDYTKNPSKLKLGNIHASRDWGYAKDYVEAMWLMLQKNEPEDFVIATGETHTVEEFLTEAFSLYELKWKDFIEFDKSLERPSEVPFLRGSAQKAWEKLGWAPKTRFKDLVRLMVQND